MKKYESFHNLHYKYRGLFVQNDEKGRVNYCLQTQERYSILPVAEKSTPR